MNQKKRQNIVDVARPLLQSGEQVEMATVANVGTVSAKRRVATAAVAGVLSGGTLLVAVKPRQFYVALTDLRILLFGVHSVTGKPEKKAAGEISRAGLTASSPKKGLMTTTVMLTFDGSDKDLKFVFPLPTRTDASVFATTLGAES